MTVQEQAKKIKLFEIGGEFEALNDLIQENGGEINESLEAFQIEIEAVEAQKIDNCVVYLRSIEAQIEGAEALEKEIAKNKKSLKNKVQNFKSYLVFCLDRSGKSEMKGNAFKLKPKLGLYSVDILNQDLIDVKFIESEQVIKVDKKAIGEAWKAGIRVDGTAWTRGDTTLSISSGV